MLGTLRRFLRASEGTVAMIFGLSLIPLIFLSGAGVDYGTAAMREAQLNAIADSASLAAVSPAMMDQTDAASVTAATNYFNAQAETLTGLTYTPANLTVKVVDSITTRSVTVSYTAQSQNFFPNVLSVALGGATTIALSGSSTAVGSVAPNIDFYLMLDDSPSMALPATAAGIAQMEQATNYQCDPNPTSAPYAGAGHCGCAFACHEANPAAENYCSSTKCGIAGTGNPGGEDNYAYARALGITLRIDNLKTAVENLTTTATQTAQTYSAHYRMAVFTFDTSLHTITSNFPPPTSNLNLVASEAAGINLLEVYDNNNACANGSCSSGSGNNDEDTNWDGAMNTMNTDLPAPGNGTNATGDTPQEVLFIVTDGMVDESAPSGGSGTMSSAYGSVRSSRQQSTVNPLTSGGAEIYSTDWCTKIKGRGIRIAIIYTQYQPLVAGSFTNYQGDGWYVNFDSGSGTNGILPMQCTGNSTSDCTTKTDNVGAQLQACASPGLYDEVTTDGDISGALAALFQQVIATAHLSK